MSEETTLADKKAALSAGQSLIYNLLPLREDETSGMLITTLMDRTRFVDRKNVVKALKKLEELGLVGRRKKTEEDKVKVKGNAHFWFRLQ